jgi:L-threonylcarbamoyladenylate synthase
MPHPPTRIISIDPDNPDPAAIDEAAAILRGGGLVAFATETVYGLGADATNPEAVARIFAVKGRPSNNPLIVHASDLVMVKSYVADWPATAATLARQFWPGPLTLVLPRFRSIPDLVTAGRDTVAIRIPAPLAARELIAATGRPIAAPSANRSSGISPTLASHVAEDLGEGVNLILDSGQTTVGLESTVLDLTTREPRILRPGPITACELEHALKGLRVREAPGDTAAADEAQPSPGRLAVHYAPRTPAIRVETTAELTRFPWPEPSRAALVLVGPHRRPRVPVPDEFQFALETPEAAARDLYVVLHQCDRMSLEKIVVVPPPDRPEWRAVRDRLWRATRCLGAEG